MSGAKFREFFTARRVVSPSGAYRWLDCTGLARIALFISSHFSGPNTAIGPVCLFTQAVFLHRWIFDLNMWRMLSQLYLT